MSCAANPMHISVQSDGTKLVLKWPKTVQYADGTASEGVTFTILAVDGPRIDVRRDRDGLLAYFEVSRDGKSYFFDHTIKDGDDGSTATRCAAASS